MRRVKNQLPEKKKLNNSGSAMIPGADCPFSDCHIGDYGFKLRAFECQNERFEPEIGQEFLLS